MPLKIPIDKQIIFIKKYKNIRPSYVEFGGLLDEILKKALDQLGYLGLVQCRAKAVDSFVSKIIMKDKYINPLEEVTDLCGARVIVHFHNQVKGVCDFIKNNFEIDEANSLDQKSRLRVNEFGYRSIHYIITPKKESILGISVKKKFWKLKAEIQVRTLAEHIWADISHDRIYKTDLTIPEEWKREAARLAAVLEDVDKEFAKMSTAIDSVNQAYEIQNFTEKAQSDKEKLKALLEVPTDDPNEQIKNILSLSAIHTALNENQEVKSILTKWIGKLKGNSYAEFRLKFEQDILEFQELLDNTEQLEDKKLQSKKTFIDKHLKKLEGLCINRTYCEKAELGFLHYRFGQELLKMDVKADDTFKVLSRSIDLMPDNPLFFVVLIECMVMRNEKLWKSIIAPLRNTLEETIKDLEQLIKLGIDAVPAWFSIGRCYFFLENANDCINAYANAVSIIRDRNRTTRNCIVDDEMKRMERLSPLNTELTKQIKLYLKTEIYIRNGFLKGKKPNIGLHKTGKKFQEFKRPVVIVAGGASFMDKKKVLDYREYIEELMTGFQGTIISGGTKAGIPGLVGEVKASMQQKQKLAFALVAYLPESLPDDAIKSDAYDKFYETGAKEFSALEILTYWADIVSSGINPSEVILIGIDGGEIAMKEYRIALSLGARVCLVSHSGRAVFEFLNEKEWKGHPYLIEVPNDPKTIWALVNQSAETILTQKEKEKLAPKVHEFYLQKKKKELKPNESDINKYKVAVAWEQLDDSLRNSNIQQVAFFEHILKRVNLGIRKTKQPLIYSIEETLSQDQLDLLASLEHARWNAERLLEGWQYGPKKNIQEKVNPCLLPWDKLDEGIRKWDYDPVKNIPYILEKAGYEVYELD